MDLLNILASSPASVNKHSRFHLIGKAIFQSRTRETKQWQKKKGL
jgi:hypothetical protein